MKKEQVLEHTKKELTACAKRGARFMDTHCSKWSNDVNPDIVDIHYSTLCVLGQKYGGYAEGTQRLGLSALQAFKLGFMWKRPKEKQDPFSKEGKRACAILTQCWRKEILWRRERDKKTLKARLVKSNIASKRTPVTAI